MHKIHSQNMGKTKTNDARQIKVNSDVYAMDNNEKC